MRVPDAPHNLSSDEWRRAVALLAATATHGENTTISPVMRESNVLTTAKRFERYLRDGN